MSPRTVLIDANLLVLLIVGRADRSLIRRHKRTQAYIESDLDALFAILNGFTKIVATPNILTEASNLLAQIGEPVRSRLRQNLKLAIGGLTENFVESDHAAEIPQYLRIGLSDAASLSLLNLEVCLLTADLDLYLAAAKAGHHAVNFHHDRRLV